MGDVAAIVIIAWMHFFFVHIVVISTMHVLWLFTAIKPNKTAFITLRIHSYCLNLSMILIYNILYVNHIKKVTILRDFRKFVRANVWRWVMASFNLLHSLWQQTLHSYYFWPCKVAVKFWDVINIFCGIKLAADMISYSGSNHNGSYN